MSGRGKGGKVLSFSLGSSYNVTDLLYLRVLERAVLNVIVRFFVTIFKVCGVFSLSGVLLHAEQVSRSLPSVVLHVVVVLSVSPV